MAGQTAAAKKKADEQVAAAEQPAEGVAPFTSYADEALDIWRKHTGTAEDEDPKRGSLTVELFADLEPLLNKPTPAAFIEVIESVSGKPYQSTGLKSTQVQFDRMNDVLGAAHWRSLIYYTQQGTVAKAVIVVGNDLHNCRLDDAGNLLTYTVADVPEHIVAKLDDIYVADLVKHADVIAVREGWGGWKSKSVGDTLKASETNALKRALARFGPGADVYRGEWDADTLAYAQGEQAPETEYDRGSRGNAVQGQQRQRQQQPAQRQQPAAQAAPEQPATPPPAPEPEITNEQAQQFINDCLAVEEIVDVDGQRVDMQALRKEAIATMTSLPENSRPSASAQWKLLAPRKDDPRQLADLITRAKNATGS